MVKKKQKVIVNFETKPLIFEITPQEVVQDLFYKKPKPKRKRK